MTRVPAPGNACGDPYTKLTLANGDYFVFCHVSTTQHVVTGEVGAGDIIAQYAANGRTGGPHMHIKYQERQANGSYRAKDPVEIFGGRAALESEGFSFNDTDPASCPAGGGE